MYECPIDDDRQKQTYDNLETQCSENARDKSSTIPLGRHTLHHAPSECRRVWTRWIAPCRCRFDYSTHKCVTRSMSNNGHAHFLAGCCHSRRCTECVTVCGAVRTLRTWKTWFTYHHLILKRIVEAAATIRQQPGIFECIRQSLLRRRRLYIEVRDHTFVNLVAVGNKLHLYFSEYFCGFAWFPTLVRPTLMVRGTAWTQVWQKYISLTMKLCCGSSYRLTWSFSTLCILNHIFYNSVSYICALVQKVL